MGVGPSKTADVSVVDHLQRDGLAGSGIGALDGKRGGDDAPSLGLQRRHGFMARGEIVALSVPVSISCGGRYAIDGG